MGSGYLMLLASGCETGSKLANGIQRPLLLPCLRRDLKTVEGD